MNSIAAASILAFAASVSAAGNAIVQNSCNYDIYLDAVPAANAGASEQDTTLGAGQTWSMPYTQLTQGGWSIKLCGDTSFQNILQYEYSWANDGTVWYDLSDVNGNPWNSNWMITSDNGDCSPRQAAYRYATDDAYGEQSCPDNADITVTLCSGSQSPPAMAGSPMQYNSTSTATWGVTATQGRHHHHAGTPVVKPTTFATQITAMALSANGAEIAEVETVYMTETVTVAPTPMARRHDHHARRHI